MAPHNLPARPQPIRDAILAFLSEPRQAVEIARHIARPVPTTTGHLAAMRRLGLVERVGYGLYALPGAVPAGDGQNDRFCRRRAAVEREQRAAFACLSRRIRAELKASPCRLVDLAGRLGSPEAALDPVLERLWLSGVITGNGATGYRFVVPNGQRKLIHERILTALSEPRTATDLADRLNVSIAVARRRLAQLRQAGKVTVGTGGKFVVADRLRERPGSTAESSHGSFARTPGRVSA